MEIGIGIGIMEIGIGIIVVRTVEVVIPPVSPHPPVGRGISLYPHIPHCLYSPVFFLFPQYSTGIIPIAR